MGMSFVLAAIVVFIIVVTFLIIKVRRKNIESDKKEQKVNRSHSSHTNTNW
jgi:hypothetical protein